MAKIKKMQPGGKASMTLRTMKSANTMAKSPVPVKKKVYSMDDAYNEYRPHLREMVGKGYKGGQASDSLINRRIKEGMITRDPKSGDIFPTKKFKQPGRVASQKNGGKVKKSNKNK